jgi:Fe-S-cluster-containing dehydrogenase component/formate-dependent nitrite reductase membrane component NrfD
MRFGFVIDQRKCIGCHACTVACKAENNEPLGNFRTWVKYVEQGQFPSTERHFSVLRCNHCDNAPCVKICPVTALFTREDGIVDFDHRRCIGCKACMQGCPYDALYINPTSNTAEKCNFCAHRVEAGMQPACVIVCPEEAIIAGDLDNPATRISQLLKSERGVSRKPEQGTRPKLYYLGSGRNVLRPDLQRKQSTYMWAETGMEKNSGIDLQKFIAEAEERSARTAYDVPHEKPWGWRVSAYLWTKSIAAGAFLLPAIALLINFEAIGLKSSRSLLAGSVLSLLFQMITSVLLVLDLKRPDRFLYILLRPQWRSWLAIGAYILVAFGAVSSLFLLSSALSWNRLTYWLAIPGALLAIFAAIYSGFLFRQAEGRDFWQSRLTTPHLFFQAVVAGSSVFGLAAAWPLLHHTYIRGALAAGLIAHLAIMLVEALGHRTGKRDRVASNSENDLAQAASLLARGPYRGWFWGGAVAAGTIIPALMILSGSTTILMVASLLALAGLLVYESLWIKVGQSVPLS